jgi:hypothetical protein
MAFANAFAQIKSRLGGETREKKSAATLESNTQLANWRSQMTPAERESLRLSDVKGVSQLTIILSTFASPGPGYSRLGNAATSSADGQRSQNPSEGNNFRN